MARSRETKIELTAYDDLFQTDELTKEECTAVIKLTELKNRLTDMELQSVYFRGCYDSEIPVLLLKRR